MRRRRSFSLRWCEDHFDFDEFCFIFRQAPAPQWAGVAVADRDDGKSHVGPGEFGVECAGDGDAVGVGVEKADDLVAFGLGAFFFFDVSERIEHEAVFARAVPDVVDGDDAGHSPSVAVSRADEDAATFLGTGGRRVVGDLPVLFWGESEFHQNIVIC